MALLLPRADPSRPVINPPSLRFEQLRPPGRIPFASGTHAAPVQILAQVRPVRGWGMDPHFPNSPAVPPSSPTCADANECGEVQTVALLPFGSTRLRIGMMPWTFPTSNASW